MMFKKFQITSCLKFLIILKFAFFLLLEISSFACDTGCIDKAQEVFTTALIS